MATREQLDWDKVPEVIDPKDYKRKQGRKPEYMRRKQGKGRGVVKGKKGWWPQEKRLEAVANYAILGTADKTSEVTGVPAGTIRQWMSQDWWPELMLRVRQEADDELDTKLTRLIDKAAATVEERLNNGDWIYDTKRGKIERKPVSAKDAAIVTAISLDKRQLLRGQPTQRIERVTSEDRLERLSEQFKRFISAKEIVQLPLEEKEYATQKGEIEESDFIEYQDGDASRQTSETSDCNSDEKSGEIEKEEEIRV